MRNLLPLLLVILLAGCSGSHHPSQDKVVVSKDSIKQKSIDSQMTQGDRSDSEQEGPTINEVKADLFSSYKKIKRVDTLIIDGTDSIKVRCKYYCLHDSALIIPKHYLWGGDTSKDFVTHNFASDIIIIKNRDTIFKRTILKKDFNRAIDKYLQKYAMLFDPEFKYERGNFMFNYSISIPLTDVGVGVSMLVDKSGKYSVIDEYGKVK